MSKGKLVKKLPEGKEYAEPTIQEFRVAFTKDVVKGEQTLQVIDPVGHKAIWLSESKVGRKAGRGDMIKVEFYKAGDYTHTSDADHQAYLCEEDLARLVNVASADEADIRHYNDRYNAAYFGSMKGKA